MQLQIWHPGRSAHSSLNAGVQPISSGERAIQGCINTPDGKQPYETPRRLRDDELPAIVDLFRQAARRALQAGSNDLQDSDPEALLAYVAQQLSQRGIAYLELRHMDPALDPERRIAAMARQHFQGPLLRNGGFTAATGQAALDEGSADAIVFGRAFIANPDLVERLRVGAALNEPEPKTYFAAGATGYTDCPRLGAEPASPQRPASLSA